jgi:N-acetyl-anhydromuramyl-L-alanine amidase AmpD
MIDIEDYGDFKSIGDNPIKKQIILTHTSRDLKKYLNSLKYRYSGKFTRIPNYVISREGKILKLLPDSGYTKFLNKPELNLNSIIITFENLGWIHKEPLKDSYINWIGDIYKGTVCERKWRDYFFWQPYTEIQLDSCVYVCKELFNKMNINNEIIGHNTRINGIEKFEGVVTRSNFDSESTDVSPAFDFELFIKKFENG